MEKKLPCTELFDCEFIVEKEVREKWPRSRRKAGTVPKIEERYHLKSREISVKEKERDEYLQKASCIVLISNVREDWLLPTICHISSSSSHYLSPLIICVKKKNPKNLFRPKGNIPSNY